MRRKRGWLISTFAVALLAAGCGAESAGAPSSTGTPLSSATTAPPASTNTSAAPSRPSATHVLITEPDAGLAPVLSAVTGARRQVDMVMYEDEDTHVNAALTADEQRGVKVRVLLNGGYDGDGSAQNLAGYSYLRAHSVPVRWTPPYFALTHQKTLIVDGRAYILTFNLTPQYYASSRDFGVIDTIPADDSAVEQTFEADWNGHPITAPTGADLVWSPGSEQAQVNLISSASGFVDVYNEEMDSPTIEQALAADAQRGVNVKVTMTAGSSWDRAFAQLTDAGVHVRTYAQNAPLYIHAKMILTSTRVFIGSENFSATSMLQNREVGLITSDRTIRASLERTFDADYDGATPFTAGGGSSSTSTTSARSQNTNGAQCSASASYSTRYGDYDVYVQSNQAQVTVTVTDVSGRSDSWHTSSSGDADVYFKAPASASGETVTVHAGSATCTTTL